MTDSSPRLSVFYEVSLIKRKWRVNMQTWESDMRNRAASAVDDSSEKVQSYEYTNHMPEELRSVWRQSEV